MRVKLIAIPALLLLLVEALVSFQLGRAFSWLGVLWFVGVLVGVGSAYLYGVSVGLREGKRIGHEITLRGVMF